MNQKLSRMRGRVAATLRRLNKLTALAVVLLLGGFAAVTASAIHGPGTTSQTPDSVSPQIAAAGDLTALLHDVRAGSVTSIVLDETSSRATATYRDGRPARSVTVPVLFQRDLVSIVSGASVALSVKDPSPSRAAGTAATQAATLQQEPDSGAAAAGPSAHEAVPHPATPAAMAPAPATSATTAAQPSSGASWIAVGGVVSMFSGGILMILALRRRDRVPASLATDQPGASSADERQLSGRAARKQAAAEAVAPAPVPDTRFADVAGCDEAIDDLAEMVSFLTEPERFTRTGAKPLKGALLAGPPGTGKTLLARAVAGEAGVPFYSTAGSDFTEKYVGVGPKRVRELFAAARKHDRAIIFIDEIDAVARRRSGSGELSNTEGENTLIALLSEMDGFQASNVVVLAATNRADILDPALTRPGRLDRKVEVPNPDRRGREKILRVHAVDKPLTGDVDLTLIARRTPGFSGAQLAALVNEACLEAARRDLDCVDQTCFDHAVATVAMGRARTSALVTDHDRTVTAWHEAGHTLAAYLQPDADDPVQVTIVPRGPAGGVTWMSGNDDCFLPRRKAHAQLVTALGGRAAEELLLDGEFTQGASGDLQSATALATRMATQYGMTDLGLQVRDPNAASQAVSEVVEQLLVQAHAAAAQMLRAHEPLLRAVAEALLEEETLTLADVADLALRAGVNAGPLPEPPPPPRHLPAPPVETDVPAGRLTAPPAVGDRRRQGERGRRPQLAAAVEPAVRAAAVRAVDVVMSRLPRGGRRTAPDEPQRVTSTA